MKTLDIYIQNVKNSTQEVDPKLLIAYLDLTSLDELDTPSVIETLCKEAQSASVAAVCIYPHFIPVAKKILATSSIKIATVANFPKGDDELSDVLESMEQSLAEGVDEIDVVIPYATFIKEGADSLIYNFVASCKKLMGTKCLKTILESGAFMHQKELERASLICLEAGSDFLKTSTGKITQGASLEAAAVMLNAIATFGDLSRGFKASGGVRQYEQAKQYYLLGQKILGDAWPKPDTFRIGASSLLKNLQDKL